MKLLPVLLFSLVGLSSMWAAPRVFMAGQDARLLTTFPLSDGTILAGGSAANLDWLPTGVTRIEFPAEAANGWKLPASEGAEAAREGFLLHLSADLGKVLAAVVLPAGQGGGSIGAIKTDTVPGSPTGAIYIAGSNKDRTRYWIGKLDANFLSGNPKNLAWGYDKETGNIGKLPLGAIWDVGSDGKVVFYNYAKKEWGIVARLRADGSMLDSVPDWPNNYGIKQEDGSEPKVLSLKTGNGDLRSRTWEEFNAITPDGYGGIRKGSFPNDLFYSQPLNEGNDSRGYTGYSSKNTAATSVAITVDRRSNDFYVGYNVQSILPPWNDIPNAPDFEPAVVAFAADGRMRWWSRLYSEMLDTAGPFVSKNDGASWERLGKGFIFGGAHDAIKVGETLYVAESSGLARLKPQGAWELLRNGIPSRPITALAATADGKKIFLGTGKGDIVVSTDGGDSWTPASQGLMPEKKRGAVTSIVVHPSKPNLLLAAIEKSGIFMSQTQGELWASLPGPPPSKNVRSLVFAPTNPSLLYALAEDGFFQTADAGASWTKFPAPGNSFTAMAIAPDDPNTIYISSNSKEKKNQGIRFTTDGGATWKEEKVGNSKILDVLALPGNKGVFCVSADRGVFKRGSDGKSDWTRLDKAPGLEGSVSSFSKLLADHNSGTVYAFTRGSGDTSSPDQYVDELAIDYSQPQASGDLVVLARAHGNNVTNLWHGKEGQSFMRRQTGTRGNEHFHWIGRLRCSNGEFVNATWFVGLDPFGGSFGKPYENPNLAGWPDHNGGNANLKGANGRALRVAADGSVAVLGTSRAAITTATAFQKMTSPLEGKAPWHDFVRVHAQDLSTVTYATALTGTGWDAEKGEGGGNTSLEELAPLPGGGFVVVGYHKGTGNPIPTFNVPAWGKSETQGESMILAILP